MREQEWAPAWHIGRAIYYACRLDLLCWCDWCREYAWTCGPAPGRQWKKGSSERRTS